MAGHTKEDKERNYLAKVDKYNKKTQHIEFITKDNLKKRQQEEKFKRKGYSGT